MASTSATTDDSSGSNSSGGLLSTLGGLMRMADPQFLMSIGAGLMSGARYGSNAGEGLMQGLQMYHSMKTSDLQNQLQRQQIQEGQLGLQQRQMMLGAAQQALQGGQGAPEGLMGPQDSQTTPAPSQPPFIPGISPMPPSGAPQPPAAPQGLPASLQAPSMGQIYGTTYPGGASPAYTRAMAMFSQDPAAALLKARDDQLKLAQQNYAPTISRLDQLIKSDTPTKYLNGQAYADIKAAWPQMAALYGFDADKDYNDQNVRSALTAVRNGMASSLNEPGEAPVTPWRTRQGPLGSEIQSNPITGEEKEVIKPEPLKDVLVNGQPTAVRASAAEGQQPFNQVTYGSAQMAGGPGALLAALATKGVSLPAGLRSQQQQIATLNGLIAANPDKTPDQIADLVRTGQLDFNGAKRSTAQLATLAGAADVQSRKIEKDLNSLEPIVQKLPGGPATLANIFTNLQKNWSWNGDANSTQAVAYVKELSGEYAKLVSGSTGQAAPAEGEMKAALGLMESALTKNGYQGMHDFLLTTSQNRRDSVREGLQNAATPGYSVGAPRGAAAQAPVRVSSPEEALALKPGTVFITPDGRTKVR